VTLDPLGGPAPLARPDNARGHRLGFRPDIEGLRAVAIALVVAAHAKVPGLAGGFVGVDVFFVLSGYLITGLLLQEFQQTGRLRLAVFYARRLQRLLPALLLALACTVAAAAVLLAPFEQLAQTGAAAAAATWTSNLYFALADLDYFGPAADSNLFLHTWSLGVEEQFYLLWPALLLFLLGAWRWQGQRADFRRLRLGLLATVAVCLALSVLLTHAAPRLGFYLVVSRGWQFALGALVFLGAAPGALPSGLDRLRGPLGWAGLVAILAAAALLDARTPYPGLWALLPALGTAAVLAAGAGDGDARQVGKLLGLAPLQGIGRVSYAWYLWHWPVLLLGLTLVDAGNPWHVAALVALSLLLAIASWALVESPVRRAHFLRQRPRLVLVGGLVLMAASVAGAAAWSRLASTWSQGADQTRYAQVRADLPALYAAGCDEWYQTARVRACYFGPDDAAHTAVLMGDSVAGQWFPAVAGHFDRPGWRLLVLTKSSCPMVDQPYFYERIGREYVECTQWRQTAIALLHELKPDVVLLGSSAAYPFSPQQWAAGTGRVLDALAGASPRIGILQPTPIPPFDGPACLARQQWRDRVLPLADGCIAPARNPQLDAIRQAVANGAAGHAGVRVIDLGDSVCPGGRCAAQRDGQIVYRDGQHLAARYVASLAGALGTALADAGLDPQPPPRPAGDASPPQQNR
jgi:peptidoglycan/LPS O-acetylase OafA/YrhL